MDPDARYERMLRPVRERIRPSVEERAELSETERTMVMRLKKVVSDEVEIGTMGSVAKGTALKGNKELDIFILMPRNWALGEMQKKGLAWARKAMHGIKTEMNYAQHPYLKAYVQGVKIDLVPSYKLHNMEKLGSAVDRSQLHTLWANARLDERLRDEVRLLKQFFKCLGVYGAQTRVEGFSGYLCELIVIHYGGFVPALRAMGGWKMPHAIDPQKHHEDGGALKLFPSTPLIVIDPVDSHRNVAAVVSKTSMARAILASRAFLAKPSPAFFFGEKEVHSSSRLSGMMKARGTHTLVLTIPSPDEVEDVLWPQLRKTAQSLVSVLERAEFRLFGHYYWSDGKRALILFETMEKELPAVRRAMGPQVWLAKDVEAFSKRHARALNLHVEHERLVALAPRRARTPKEVLEQALHTPEKIGIPAPFIRVLKRKKWEKAAYLLKDKALREVASDYFSRRI